MRSRRHCWLRFACTVAVPWAVPMRSWFAASGLLPFCAFFSSSVFFAVNLVLCVTGGPGAVWWYTKADTTPPGPCAGAFIWLLSCDCRFPLWLLAWVLCYCSCSLQCSLMHEVFECDGLCDLFAQTCWLICCVKILHRGDKASHNRCR